MNTSKSVHKSGSHVRRRDIIQAALSCFVEYGYATTTMEDIRLRSGASNGSIYHHFKSKEQLAVAVYLEGIKEWQDGFLVELERHRKARQGIAGVIKFHLRWVSENPVWARYLIRMGQTEIIILSGETIDRSNQEWLDKVTAWLNPHIEAGTIKRLPVEIYMPLIISPCFRFSSHWIDGTSQIGLESASKIFAEAAWQSLKAP